MFHLDMQIQNRWRCLSGFSDARARAEIDTRDRQLHRRFETGQPILNEPSRCEIERRLFAYPKLLYRLIEVLDNYSGR